MASPNSSQRRKRYLKQFDEESDYMNLEAKHFPLILMGGVIGAVLGWLASFVFKTGILPEIENVVGLRGAGLIFGGIAGMAFAVIATVVRAARDPNAEPARNFTQINGMGSALIGHSESNDDGSYITTEWFTILWIPIFPVCRYRLIKHKESSNLLHREYTIIEKLPPQSTDTVKVYGFTVAILLVIIGLAYLTFK